MNYENKNDYATNDIMIDIPSNASNLHWKDITDPKLREKERIKAWKLKNREKLNQKNREYRKANSDKQKEYYIKNKEKIINKTKEWRQANLEYDQQRRKAYRIANKDKLNQHRRNRMKTDIQFRLGTALRRRLHTALKKNYKVGSAVNELGCSIEQFKTYLESKWLPGMNWENHGLHGWHIDHIKPLASFDLTDKKQLEEACHYTNLQPLWAKDNIAKSNNI